MKNLKLILPTLLFCACSKSLISKERFEVFNKIQDNRKTSVGISCGT